MGIIIYTQARLAAGDLALLISYRRRPGVTGLWRGKPGN